MPLPKRSNWPSLTFVFGLASGKWLLQSAVLVNMIQHLAHLAGQRFRSKRFWQEESAGIEFSMVNNSVGGVSRHVEDSHARPASCHLAGQFGAAPPRHHNVRK